MTRLTSEQTEYIIRTIKTANERVAGTENYYKYHMQEETIITRKNPLTGEISKHWHFVGHYIPSYIHQNDDVIIYKKIKNTEWLYYGEERYMLNEEVKSLFI